MESKVGVNKYQSVVHLKQVFRRKRCQISQSLLQAAFNGFIGHLKAVYCTKGGQFKQKLIVS